MAATFRFSNSNGQNTSAASLSVTNTISTGDSIVVFGYWNVLSVVTPDVVTTGGSGSDTLTLIYGPFVSGNKNYAAWLVQSCGAGRTGVTLTWSSSSPSSGDAFCISFFGLVNPVLDGQGFAAGTTTPFSSADTATLASTDEFAIGYAATTGVINSTIGAGWTSDGISPVTSSGGQHQVVTATTPIHTNFGETGGTWLTFVLTFMAAPIVTSFTGYVFDVGQSPPAAPTKMIGY